MFEKGSFRCNCFKERLKKQFTHGIYKHELPNGGSAGAASEPSRSNLRRASRIARALKAKFKGISKMQVQLYNRNGNFREH